jgi:hypothetical protein
MALSWRNSNERKSFAWRNGTRWGAFQGTAPQFSLVQILFLALALLIDAFPITSTSLEAALVASLLPRWNHNALCKMPVSTSSLPFWLILHRSQTQRKGPDRGL